MKALIIVDVQNDFCPGGALAVPQGNTIVPVINRLNPLFECVIATQDWHPKDHSSFASNHHRKPGERILCDGMEQILWPDHCVQGSWGAEFVTGLDRVRFDKIFKKGTDKNIDSYSAFFDNVHKKATGLGDYLNLKKIKQIYVVGLATDYCIKFTALDGVRLGFDTILVADACRGVNLRSGDVDAAIEEMIRNGVKVIQSRDLIGYEG